MPRRSLNRPVGAFAATMDKQGLANWMAAAVADEADAEVGFYHIGGVRLDSIAAGGVGVARVYDLEPFGTQVARMEMTPAEMRRMIVTKYNEPTREGHRIDLVSTTPYAILVDDEDRAFDVRFPELREDRRYKVAVSDYVYRNYHDLHCTEGGDHRRKGRRHPYRRVARGQSAGGRQCAAAESGPHGGEKVLIF